MKKSGMKICLVILLIAGLIIPTAAESIIQAADTEKVAVYLWDLTGKKPVRKMLEYTESKWTDLKNQLKTIRTTSDSIEESFNAQFALFKEYGIISYDMTYETLRANAMESFKNKQYRPARQPAANNIIINAICAINFELTNGTTLVFGLNTFINLVGFDIISFHRGYSPDGIQTKGLLEQSTDPGEYIGSMFGLLGYWFGTKTGTGTYSDVVVSGFTVATTWLPLP